jgi:branched-subunit amino acid transport protein
VSVAVLIALVVLTYGSRAAALAFLPALPGRWVAVVDRMPPALFAGLAAQSLTSASGGLVETPVLAAAAGALLVAPRRSLPICLAAGLACYGLALLVA